MHALGYIALLHPRNLLRSMLFERSIRCVYSLFRGNCCFLVRNQEREPDGGKAPGLPV